MEIKVSMNINRGKLHKKSISIYIEEICCRHQNDSKKLIIYNYSMMTFPKYNDKKKTLALYIFKYKNKLDKVKCRESEKKQSNTVKNNSIEKLLINISLNKYVYNLYRLLYSVSKVLTTSFNPIEINKHLKEYTNDILLNNIIYNIKKNKKIGDILLKLNVELGAYEAEMNKIYEKKKVEEKLNLKEGFDKLYNIFSEYSVCDGGKENQENNTIIINNISNIISNDISQLNFIQKISSFLKTRNILMEIRFCIIEEKIQRINPFGLFTRNDFFLKIKYNIIKWYKSKNFESLKDQITNQYCSLNQNKMELIKKNYALKQKLIKYLEERRRNIYLCFKCGNIVFYSKISQPASCSYDEKCSNNSFFYCRKCDINFCSYCIPIYRNSSCYENHLILQIEVNFKKICFICDAKFYQLGYECKFCKFPICNKCYKSKVELKAPNCKKCLRKYIWIRGRNSYCSLCKKLKECFWRCYSCYDDVCLNCQPINYNNQCGGLHILEEIILKKKESLEEVDNKSIWRLLGLRKISCSICDRVFPQKYKTCIRCNYAICEICHKTLSI